MESTESHMDPLQGLQTIAGVIARTRENIKEQSFYFLLWGWLIAIASLLFFILHAFTSTSLFFLPFPVLVTGGIIVSVMHYKGKPDVTETYLNFYLNQLWMVLAICFILVVIINVAEQLPPFTYTLLICGIGTLVSGLTMRFRPLIVGGVMFLLFTVASVFVTDTYKPLLQGIAVIIGYLVPGYLLKYSKS